MSNTSTVPPTVFVVDDDSAIRGAMHALLESVDLACETFATGEDFLESFDDQRPGCLVLDIRMPSMSGLDLQDRLNSLGSSLPIVFLTGHGDVPMAVEAMQKGAIDFLQKPFRDQELLDCVGAALKTDANRRNLERQHAEIEARTASLTKREREVYDLVVSGMPNKQAAYELGVSQRTIEIHRARVMKKMQARSLAELVRMHLASARN